MLGQVNETEFDLRFSLFGIPVRVHPGFWIVAILMARGYFKHDNGLPFIGLWVVCLFVSILIHEMGHALAIRYYRSHPHVVIHYFGGYAAYQPIWGQSHKQSIVIAFAGPAAGFVLYGLTKGFEYWYFQMYGGANFYVFFTVLQLIWINLWWGLVNLLPILPLDGGQIFREVMFLSRTRDPMEKTLKTGMFLAGAGAILVLVYRDQLGVGFYPAILLGFLCFYNFQMHEQHRRSGGSW